MSLIDSSVLTIINQICNSHGDFNDEFIENSFFFKIISERDWIYKLKQVSICYNDDLILQNEKKLMYMEEKLKNIFGNLDLYTMQDFNVFINILYSQIKREQFLFLKKNKIQEILENLKYKHIKCMEKFSSYEKMCISRLIFDEDEHEKLYNEYKGIKKNDLTWQPIKILVLDNKEKMCNYLLKKKCTVWDEKIGGTIFSCAFDKENNITLPYLRTMFRFFHYYFELQYTSMFYECLDDKNFGEKFSSYIKGKFNDVDFFEPHALLESRAWQQTIRYIMSNYDYLFDGIWDDVLIKKSEKEICVYPNCIVDYISNMIHFRNVKEWRVTSMIIKEKLFELIVGKENVDSMLIRCMDSGSMKGGYEYNMYNK